MAAEQDTPSSSSSSSSSPPPTTTQPPSSKSPEAKRQLTNLPRLFVVRGPVGASPSVDERCFTYCSQSVRGRSEGKDPWCRSLCWRRVHKHEVKGNPIPLAPNPTPPRSRVNADASGPPPSLVNVSTLNGEKENEADNKGQQKSQESWEEGRYIWYSKGKGSAQVRLEHMRHDVRQMEQWRAAWREKEAKELQEREAKARARAAQVQAAQAAAAMTQPPPPPKSLSQVGAENMAAAQVEKRRAAAAAAAAQARQQDSQSTTLIPVASLPSVIRAEISRRWENLLKPSRLLITTVANQAATGSYGRTTDKIWENVTTGQALKLLDKVARKIEKIGDELDEEDRKAGGGAQSTK